MNKHSNLTNDSLLIGVLIDVSLSMKENWKQEKVKIPTIEVIRDAINKEINIKNFIQINWKMKIT